MVVCVNDASARTVSDSFHSIEMRFLQEDLILVLETLPHSPLARPPQQVFFVSSPKRSPPTCIFPRFSARTESCHCSRSPLILYVSATVWIPPNSPNLNSPPHTTATPHNFRPFAAAPLWNYLGFCIVHVSRSPLPPLTPFIDMRSSSCTTNFRCAIEVFLPLGPFFNLDISIPSLLSSSQFRSKPRPLCLPLPQVLLIPSFTETPAYSIVLEFDRPSQYLFLVWLYGSDSALSSATELFMSINTRVQFCSPCLLSPS